MNEGCLLFDYTARALLSTQSAVIPLSKLWEINQQTGYQTSRSFLEVTAEKGILSSGSSHSHFPTPNSRGVITILYFPAHVPHSEYHTYHNQKYTSTKNTIRKMSMQNYPQSLALHVNFFFFSLKA